MGTKNSRQQQPRDVTDSMELLPTMRITPKIPIPRQMELVQSQGCSVSGGSLGCRRLPFHQSNYHPWSTTRKCTRSSLLSAIAWNPTRIRNIILAVGPGTPAHVLWHRRYGGPDWDEERNYEWEAEFEHGGMVGLDTDSLAASYASDNLSEHEEEKDESDDEDIEIEGVRSSNENVRTVPTTQPPLVEQLEQPTTVDWLPSMRHDGCVNTACWLNCAWRVSGADGGMSFTSGEQIVLPKSIMSSDDIPTQVMTSGDDGLIKVWDLSNSIGSASPLSGGWDTFSPLTMTNIKELGSEKQKESWKSYYEEREGICKVAGSVRLLSSMHSKHRRNVFHVSPIADIPGKVLSCGADGFLRLSDLESGSSSVVIDPHIHDDFEEEFTVMLGGGFGVTAFSHLSLTQNTGLLCCQRGLFRFDIRVPPNVQSGKSLLDPIGESRSFACKACAIWSPTSNRDFDSYPQYLNAKSEPTYVFAGGFSQYVELLDLRMISAGSSQQKSVLQRYCPRELRMESPVTVSGIDVSKDGRELLVSYENDQIYTFPIFHSASNSSAGPTKDELDCISKDFRRKKELCVSELALYAGRLNRRTFLKSASYAGPNDEYIISGSDSGKAFIYDRSTTCVAALLSADSSTCNGIVAHPMLPLFVTYGIDTSAKLWRACSSQDSPALRAKASIEIPDYELSFVTCHWSKVQSSLHRFIEKDTPLILPDLVASSDEIYFSSSSDNIMMDIVSGTMFGSHKAEYGNALRCVSPLLHQTTYKCYRADRDDRLPPIISPLTRLAVGVAWNRLRLQALSLGMDINPWAPWLFENKNPHWRVEDTVGFHKADLVPDYPSDWIFFDPQLVLFFAINFQIHFNIDDYLEVLRNSFPENDVFFGPHETMRENFLVNFADTKLPWTADSRWDHQFEYSEDFNERTAFKESWSTSIFEETVLVLKEGGNEAMKLGFYHKAAQRYDKAIRYCAVAFMEHTMAIPNHPSIQCNGLIHLYRGRVLPSAFFGRKIKGYKSVVIKDGTQTIVVWSSTLQVLIASRLNLSLLLLKPEFGSPSLASQQALEALRLLYPFATRPCMVFWEGCVLGKDEMQDCCRPEPIATYRQAKPLQAKAYFRLGCAHFDLKEYRKAIKNFKLTLASFQLAKCDRWGKALGTVKPDPLVLRRIEEAEIKLKEKEKATAR